MKQTIAVIFLFILFGTTVHADEKFIGIVSAREIAVQQLAEIGFSLDKGDVWISFNDLRKSREIPRPLNKTYPPSCRGNDTYWYVHYRAREPQTHCSGYCDPHIIVNSCNGSVKIMMLH